MMFWTSPFTTAALVSQILATCGGVPTSLNSKRDLFRRDRKFYNPETLTFDDFWMGAGPDEARFGAGDGIITCSKTICQQYCRVLFDLSYFEDWVARGKCVGEELPKFFSKGKWVGFVRGWCECRVLPYALFEHEATRDDEDNWRPISRQFVTTLQDESDGENIVGYSRRPPHVLTQCFPKECNRWCLDVGVAMDVCEDWAGEDAKYCSTTKLCGGDCFNFDDWPSSNYTITPGIDIFACDEPTCDRLCKARSTDVAGMLGRCDCEERESSALGYCVCLTDEPYQVWETIVYNTTETDDDRNLFVLCKKDECRLFCESRSYLFWDCFPVPYPVPTNLRSFAQQCDCSSKVKIKPGWYRWVNPITAELLPRGIEFCVMPSFTGSHAHWLDYPLPGGGGRKRASEAREAFTGEIKNIP